MGVDAHPVQVEVNTGEAGELKFILVGLPDAAVKESQSSYGYPIAAALRQTQWFSSPISCRLFGDFALKWRRERDSNP
ncbi:MAG: hypothetical protein VXU50_02490, partial [Verrucomicrobiota bacterium]|nr:hypothetical protein [Verrucomicrobiota bacterium]